MALFNCDNVVKNEENTWIGDENGIPRIQKK